MKKIIVFMLTVIISLLITSNGFAEKLLLNYDGAVHEYTGRVYDISLNGEAVSTSVPPVVLNDRTLVPARAIFETLGAKVDWDAENRKVAVSLNGSNLEFKINDKNALVNNNVVSMDVPAKIINNTTMLPVRFVAEQLNMKVDWNPEGNLITISKSSIKTITYTSLVSEKQDDILISLDYYKNYKIIRLDSSRIVVDFPNVDASNVPQKIEVNGLGVKSVRAANFVDSSNGFKAARVVLVVYPESKYEVEEKSGQLIVHVKKDADTEANNNSATSDEVQPKIDVVNGVSFTAVNETVYTTVDLNIRTGPGVEYEKIGLAKCNQAVNRTAIGDNEWSRIEYSGQMAYCSSQYLRKEGTTSVAEGKTLDEKIRNYLGSKINSLGIVYYDLTTGEKYEINENKKFLAASTVKVQLNMLVYNQANQGDLKLSDTIAYKSSFYEGGTGILQNQNLSKPIQIQTLLDYAIKYSDNIATNMLISTFGGSVNMRKQVNATFGLDMDTSGNYITPEGEYTILKSLYDNKDNENYAHLIEVMKNTIFHDRIDKYIPQDIVAHKIGNYGSYVNDVGIVFAEKPYIFVMYTNGVSNASETIAKVSQIIYDYHNSK